MSKQSPCECCRRVPVPQECQKRDCPIWQYWWIREWNETVAFLREKLMTKEIEDDLRRDEDQTGMAL